MARLLQLFRVVAEAELREAKDRLRNSAMVGWQLRQLMGGEQMTFGEYLDQLGLGAKERARIDEGPPITRDGALAKAAAALEKLRIAGVQGARS